MKRLVIIGLLSSVLTFVVAAGAEKGLKKGSAAAATTNALAAEVTEPVVSKTEVPLAPPDGEMGGVGRTSDIYQQWKDRWEQAHGKNKPERARPELPEEVKKLIDELKTKKDTFWAEQKAILEKIKTATEADREALKSVLNQNREAYREQVKETAKELQERLKEIRNEFRNRERDRVVDSAKEDGKKGR